MEIEKKLQADFFKTEQNNEPVRDFLKGLSPEDKKICRCGYYGCRNVLADWLSDGQKTRY